MELANAMQLDINEEDIEMLLESHSEELTNEELLEINRHLQEAAKREEEPEVPKQFTVKGLCDFSVHSIVVCKCWKRWTLMLSVWRNVQKK